jgi:hypothetical protein
MKRIFGVITFNLLLYGLGVRLYLASKRNAALKEHMEDQDFVLQIQTGDGKHGRHFIVRDGSFSTRPGIHPDPTFSQSWKNPYEAFRLLLKKDEQTLKRAFDDGKFRMKGNFLVAFWFAEALKIAEKG